MQHESSHTREVDQCFDSLAQEDGEGRDERDGNRMEEKTDIFFILQFDL